MDRHLAVHFPWLQQGRGKLLLVGCIGKMLGFQADSSMFIVNEVSGFIAAVEKITRIKLDSRLCGEYLELPSRLWLS